MPLLDPMQPQERLDSWKEIAAYLKRDVTTVQRWEKREGMPVHRHMHNRLPSVYAYRSELEAWWNNRHPALEAEDGERRPEVPWKQMAVAVAALLGVSLALWSLQFLPNTALGTVMREVADPSDVLLWGGGPSADGKYLPFTESEAGNLALLDLETGEARVLTSKVSWGESPEHAFSSRISPDGESVAYSWSAQGDFFDLRVIGIDGSGPRIVLRNEDVENLDVFGFLPDARSVLVGLSNDRSRSELAIVPLDGSPTRTVLTFESATPFQVSLSPDGYTVVYDLPSRSGAGDRDLFLASTDGGQET
ncbi:MAG TPA: hypothetical protein VEK15_24670, partial [Vicinamibacteria bacterium]|nr:hypothetical protein [Vicinamibacteria bacterium]